VRIKKSFDRAFFEFAFTAAYTTPIGKEIKHIYVFEQFITKTNVNTKKTDLTHQIKSFLPSPNL
jgi:hypothetical protein